MIRHPRVPILFASLLTAIALTAPIAAQDAAEERPLTISDYQLWRTISGSRISDDGRWVSWTYSRVRSDDELHVRSLDSDVTHAVPNASESEFSDDGTWIAYFIDLPFREAEELEEDGEDVPRQVGLMALATGETLTWDEALSFRFSEGSSHFYVEKGETTDDAEHDGTDLILRNLREGYEELIGSVHEVAFNDPGTHLAFTVDAAGMDGNGLYIIDLGTGARRGPQLSRGGGSPLAAG